VVPPLARRFPRPPAFRPRLGEFRRPGDKPLWRLHVFAPEIRSGDSPTEPISRYSPPVPDAPPFWKTTPLEAMTPAQWESLCDGCGRCCLHKLRDDETEALAYTEVACRLLDTASCRCSDYAGRRRKVPDCVQLTAAQVTAIDWLPPSCGYRLVAEGRELFWWHPLVSGRAETVHEAGVSVRGKVVSERVAGALEDHVVRWPGRMPRGRPPAGATSSVGKGNVTP